MVLLAQTITNSAVIIVMLVPASRRLIMVAYLLAVWHLCSCLSFGIESGVSRQLPGGSKRFARAMGWLH